jgi:hypothetical protein
VDDATRAEDESYLRIVALSRAGAVEDMRRAAQRYLQRFPTGFRRPEVERLAATRQAPPSSP